MKKAKLVYVTRGAHETVRGLKDQDGDKSVSGDPSYGKDPQVQIYM